MPVDIGRPGVLEDLLRTPVDQLEALLEVLALALPVADLDVRHGDLAVLLEHGIALGIQDGKELSAVVAALEGALVAVVRRELQVEGLDDVLPLRVPVVAHVLDEVHLLGGVLHVGVCGLPRRGTGTARVAGGLQGGPGGGGGGRRRGRRRGFRRLPATPPDLLVLAALVLVWAQGRYEVVAEWGEFAVEVVQPVQVERLDGGEDDSGFRGRVDLGVGVEDGVEEEVDGEPGGRRVGGVVGAEGVRVHSGGLVRRVRLSFGVCCSQLWQ